MLHKLCVENNTLSLLWLDGSEDAFSSDWLLDNAPDLKYDSGQKAYSILDIPEKVEILAAEAMNDGISLMFAPDQKTIFFPHNSLKGRSHRVISDRSEHGKQLWIGAELGELPSWSLTKFANHLQSKRQALEAFLRLGVFKLTDVPCESEQVLEVVKLFGFVRETNYGKLFDVRSAINPQNQAFTRRGLNQHTDNPYRDPLPTVQLLHCLSNTAEGGDSFLLDGFLAAKRLREHHSEAFTVLSQYDIPFCYEDENTVLRSSVRLIETGHRGDIHKVRYNNRSIAAVNMSLSRQQQFYAAYRQWAKALQADDLRLTFKLNPGEAIIFDNTRIMHGRHGYTAAGERHLQGAYSDLDGLYSTLYTLRKQLGDMV